MIKIAAPLASAFLMASCNTVDDGSGLTAADRRGMEAQAVQNAECVFENQARCTHIIENRTQLSLYFAPDSLSKLDANEKIKGMRVTKNFVVEAAAAIKQCNKISDSVLPLIKGMEINGEPFQVMGTSPLSPQSKCYIIREAS